MVSFSGPFFVSNFDVPNDLTNLWKYMANMYNLDAFTQSCPADQDIINHYKLQQVRKYETEKYLASLSCFLLFLGCENGQTRRTGNTHVHHISSARNLRRPKWQVYRLLTNQCPYNFLLDSNYNWIKKASVYTFIPNFFFEVTLFNFPPEKHSLGILHFWFKFNPYSFSPQW